MSEHKTEKDYTWTALAPVQRDALVRAADRLEAACNANVPAPDFEERDAARALIMAVRINVGMDEPGPTVTETEWGVVVDGLGSTDMAASQEEARSWLAAGEGLSLVRV